MGEILKDKRLQVITPLLLILYKVAQTKKISVDAMIEAIHNLNKKTVGIIALAILTVLYVNKDKISELLIKEKIVAIPVVGKFATPLSKGLNKIPSVRKEVFKKLVEKLNLG